MASKLETANMCPVCLDTVKDPQILACQHKLCSHCLQQHISATAMAGNTYHCPSCNVELKKPDDGNAHLEALIAMLATEDDEWNEPGASAIMCTNTDHGQATVFCSDCDECYCQSCASSHHVIKLTRNHNMEPVDKMSPQVKSACNTCAEHEQQQLDIWCKKCNKFICKKCALFKHKDHWYKHFIDAVREAKRELDNMVAEATEYITQQDDRLTEHEQVKEGIESNTEAAKTSVKSVAKKMRDIIDNYESHMLNDLDDYKVEVYKVLESHDNQTKSNKAMASKFKQEANSLCSSGSDVDQVMNTLSMQNKFDAMKASHQQRVIWKYEPTIRPERYDSLTKIFGSADFNLGSSLTAQDKIRLGQHLNQVPLISSGGCPDVTGMVVFFDILCVTRMGSGDLQLFDMRSGQNKSCQVPGMGNPQGMALVSSAVGKIVITDLDYQEHSKLHFVKISTDLNIAYHRVEGNSIKKGAKVTVSRETGQLLIGNENQFSFDICSINKGEILKSVSLPVTYGGSYVTGNRYGKHCYCVTGTRNGYAALICNMSSNVIIRWVDQDGKCGHTYGSKRAQTIGNGKHMISDSKGRLIVVDNSNNRLHLVDSSGQFSQFLLTKDDGINHPDCVFLDEASARLYVAHRGSEFTEVRVYRWPLSPLSGEVQNTHFNLKLNLCQLT